jgi:myo-inositol-1(or 4)-monophosphatase
VTSARTSSAQRRHTSPGEEESAVREALAVAVEAAHQASDYLMEHFGPPRKVERKESHHSVVSEQDRGSEALIIDRLMKDFPDHSFISEEAGRKGGDEDYLWVIDPLDGSSYYARGLPTFSTSLALLHRGEVILAVVSCPALGEFFSASKGKGAYLDGERIETSTIDRLDDSILSFGHRVLRLDDDGARTRDLLKSVRSVRAGGSCAQELCYVACGRIEGVISRDQRIWDYAAGKLILEEAGGILTSLGGAEPELETLGTGRLSLVASNGPLHRAILEKLKAE